jgi:tetratricopeptide (TPR) repeat protein
VTATATDPRPAPPPPSRARRRGLRLGPRIFLFSALLILLAVGAAVVYTAVVSKRVAQQSAERDLEGSAAIQAAFQRQRYAQLELISRLFVADPYLTAYLAEAVAADDRQSVLDLLVERQEDLGYDFAIVLDSRGTAVARTDRPGAAGEDLAARPLVAEALESYFAAGVWIEDDGLYDAVAVPVTEGVDLLGFLVTGFAVTDASAREAMGVSGTEVAVVARRPEGPELVASTLDGAVARELEAALGRLTQDAEKKQLAQQGVDAIKEAEAKKQAEAMQRPTDKKEFLALAQQKAKASELPLARQLYSEFMKKWAKDPLMGEAHFGMGETYFAEAKCREALFEYGKVLQDFPKTPSAPEAYLRSSECFTKLKMKEESRLALEELVKSHPKSEAAKTAKTRLTELDKANKKPAAPAPAPPKKGSK